MNKQLGTAAWLDPREAAARFAMGEGAFWLGRSPLDDATPIGYGDDRHICLVSGSRGGKGVTTIINNLALWPGSVVVVDPKGENATVTAGRRGPGSEYTDGMGQDVHVLDPFETAHIPETLRSRYNPLDALDPAREETIDEAGRIADALIVMNPESKDPFWEESARAMLKALILHVLTAEEFESERTLLTVRDLIARGDAKKVELLREMGETELPSAHAMLWEGVSLNARFHGVLERAGSSFANMFAHSPKQYESVRQTADRNTEFMDSPGMRRCLETSDFRLSELKTNPRGVSMFLSLPQRYMSTHFRWLRMMIGLTVTEMEATPGKPATGHRVLFCLDEFAGLRRMEVVENAVAQIAGHGVKMMFVLQSLEQLKAVYKDKWETFLSNCGLKIFFSLEDYFSREYVSKFIGDAEVIREGRTRSESTGTQRGNSHSTSYQSSASINEQSSVSTNKTITHSTQSNSSVSHGTSRGRSGGSNWGLNVSRASNNGSTWKPGSFFGKEEEKRSDGVTWTPGGSYGRNSGWNDGVNDSRTAGQGRSYSDGRSEGLSESQGQSFSESHGHSESQSFSESETRTTGINESVHKRRLITEDELGSFFRRITEPEHPAYPGFALALASGESPMFVRKANYYEDERFIRLFDPHPDHPFTPRALPPPENRYVVQGPDEKLIALMNDDAARPFHIERFLVDIGERVEAGQPIAEISGNKGFVYTLRLLRVLIAEKRPLPNLATDEASKAFRERQSAFILAPISGVVVDFPAAARRLASGGFALTHEPILVIRHREVDVQPAPAHEGFEVLARAAELTKTENAKRELEIEEERRKRANSLLGKIQRLFS